MTPPDAIDPARVATRSAKADQRNHETHRGDLYDFITAILGSKEATAEFLADDMSNGSVEELLYVMKLHRSAWPVVASFELFHMRLVTHVRQRRTGSAA